MMCDVTVVPDLDAAPGAARCIGGARPPPVVHPVGCLSSRDLMYGKKEIGMTKGTTAWIRMRL
jgi:hypothetical protein